MALTGQANLLLSSVYLECGKFDRSTKYNAFTLSGKPTGNTERNRNEYAVPDHTFHNIPIEGSLKVNPNQATEFKSKTSRIHEFEFF